jgi:nicotinate phosphoribosyltransferase
MFLDYLHRFRFSGDIDSIPEGTVAFAGEPLVRVTAPRIEAQLVETLLLNQVNFQTAIATKAARIALAIGHGLPDRQGRLIDFSPRRDHGVDAAMKAARSAAIAGAGGTSNVAAAMRYGLEPVGTMAHSYVQSSMPSRTRSAPSSRTSPATPSCSWTPTTPSPAFSERSTRRARPACGSRASGWTRATCSRSPGRHGRCSTARA